MTGVFLRIVNMSISAGWLVLAVLLLRLLLRRAPKWVPVLLWGMTALRLICPFSVESALSLLPRAETVPTELLTAAPPTASADFHIIGSAADPAVSASLAEIPSAGPDPLQLWLPAAAVLWLLGLCAMLMYAVITALRLRKRVETAVLLRDRILQSEYVPAPFVFGLVKPRIYLPFGLEEPVLEHVIAHEEAHIRRRDHWWKPLGFLLLSLHWFNPLIWLAYALFCRDIELACDERVIRGLDPVRRADYTRALLTCSVSRRGIAACPLAFGEVGVKARIRSVLHYKKPAFWVILLSLLLCAAAAVCFLTDPAGSSDEPDLSFLNYENAAVRAAQQEEVQVIVCPREGSELRIGTVSGQELAAYLDTREWRQCAAPRQTLYTPGSVEFVLGETYRVTVHDRKEGSLLRYAVVRHGEDLRYYRISRRDYKEAVSVVYAPDAPPPVMKWFDAFTDPEAPYWDSPLSLELDAFPDVTFYASSGEIRAETGGESTTLIYGMPIRSCYLTDLTGDGCPDLCANLSMGSGVIDERIVIHDYANGAGYELSAWGAYDFILRYDEADGYLRVEKRDSRTRETVAEGRLLWTDGCVTVDFPEDAASDEDPASFGALSVTIDTGSAGLPQGFLPAYYPEGFDWDYGALPYGTVPDGGTLIFDAGWETDTLVISEDYYNDYGDTGYIEKETHTLTRNSSGQFELEVSYRGRYPEYAVYFIGGETGVYVMKVFFGAKAAQVCDLGSGRPELSAEALRDYALYTNSGEISVTVRGGGGTLILTDHSNGNADIQSAAVSGDGDVCRFTGLTSPGFYALRWEGTEGCTFLIED